MNRVTGSTVPSYQRFAFVAAVLGGFLVLGVAQAVPPVRAATQADTPAKAPVLVELFTSEGCSSCPPADALLARLADQADAQHRDVILLSEHVTYWNYLGWSDPYSTATSTERQNDYARRFGIDGPYTPQMVVSGRTQFVGSDEGSLRRTLHGAAGAQRGELSVALVPGSPQGRLQVAIRSGEARPSARLIVVLVQREGHQQVARGENGGRLLRHVSIARAFHDLGTAAEGKPLAAETSFKLPEGARAADYQVVAFVQQGAGGPIVASAATE